MKLCYNIFMKNLDKEKTYVLGVSGGPDSMALLDMAYKQGLKIVVAHMNYLKRDSAKRDEEIVVAYCEARNIPCIVRHQTKTVVGNFQAFARKERYQLYREVLNKYQGDCVLLAHQLDDHLETYYMQIKRKSSVSYYGMRKEIMLNDCLIKRPLLGYEKKALEAYCLKYQIPYGIDESNLSDDYTRNQIRHEVIELMTYDDKVKLAKEIDIKNEALKQELKEVDAFLLDWDYQIEALLQFEIKIRLAILANLIFRYLGYYLSHKEIEMIESLCHKVSFERDLNEAYAMELAYGKLYIYCRNDISYSYRFNEVKEFSCDQFKLAFQGKVIEGVTLGEKDFPIVIRNALKDDVINLRYGHKKLNRFFIDRKIPKFLRKSWPVMVNNEGKIVFVVGIGCEIAHFSNNPTIFVVK